MKILNEREMQDRLAKLGMQPASLSTVQFAEFNKAEILKWAQVIKSANIKAD